MNDYEPDTTNLEPGKLVNCPTCGLPAEITDRFTLGGVPGPVEHVKIVCIRRHWYTLPVDMVTADARSAGVPLEPANADRGEHDDVSGRCQQRQRVAGVPAGQLEDRGEQRHHGANR
jgi:hypothetical protein